MAFWSGEKLRAEIPRLEIIDPFIPEQVDCSAYTLRMGRECYVTPEESTRSKDNKKKYIDAPVSYEVGGGTHFIGEGSFRVPPGQFAFLLTEEFISLPAHVMGFISLKSKVKWGGLINVSGFHVDPGFRGHLIYSVYNAGPSPIHIARGDDLFLLWIADLDRDSNETREGKPPLTEIPSALISQVDHRIYSLQQLSKKIDRLQNQLTVFGTVAGILATAAALVFAAMKLLSG